VAELEGYATMIKSATGRMSPEQRVEWAARQAYIALGVLVAVGAVERIDVGPMEGFDPAKFDEILGLEKMGLESKVAAAVGFRSAKDEHAQDKKVRFSREEVVIEIK
jgi:nitroreductase